ncbi:MAG TPA: hypothetical protein VFR58_01740 [Flavisolibacter sp.]|nr:hypothetical protein [Flavisolibacter sp.]
MKLIFLLLPLGIMGFLIGQPGKTKPKPVRQTIYCAPSFDPLKLNAANAPLFKGLGNLDYRITTGSPKAQLYFNQGLTLLYAFNHGEAGRSFKAAIKLDSTCAMAWWGLAMVLGPNYNAALNPSSLTDINEAIDKAMLYAAEASPKEKVLIHALSKRFPREAVEDMTPFYAAYASAMKQAWTAFPSDAEIGSLYVDALMNEHPWNLWLKDGTPQPWTPAIVQTLETLLALSPNHPGINHQYIHTMEASREAARALPSARRLGSMLPSAGHLVHMPSHVFIRTGFYHEGVLANERAAAADSSYIAQCKVQGVYPMMYYPHNIHFLAACAFLEGNSKKAIDAAWRLSRNADKTYIQENPAIQHYFSIPYYVLVHLGKWDDILKLVEPDPALEYPGAIWHYARGMAFAAKGRLEEASLELAAVKAIAKNDALRTKLIWETNSVADLIQIADLVLDAEVEGKKKNFGDAIKLLRSAVAIEDKLTYQEPPDWFFSVRHSLGHLQLQARLFSDAEQTYQQDLLTYPENGWSLMGLIKSMEGQGRKDDAAAVRKRFNKAWAWADLEINSSRIY